MNVKVDTLEDLHAEFMKDPEYAVEYERQKPYYDRLGAKYDTSSLEELKAAAMKNPVYATAYYRQKRYYDGFSDGYDLGTYVDKDTGAKQMKTGFKTSEFYVTAVVNIIAAVIAILGIRGLVAAVEGDLYVALASAVATTVAPLVMAFVSGKYIQGRSQVKAANGYAIEPVGWQPPIEGE